MSEMSDNALNTNPYPGLRPFDEEEQHLFFGRENQIDELVGKLGQSRFVAVVGVSGSGKSSLVNCGLFPALHAGLLSSAGANWRIAKFRPAGAPIREMAAALAGDKIGLVPALTTHEERQRFIETKLEMSKLALIDLLDTSRSEERRNLLIVVDQFEELFRFPASYGQDGQRWSEETTAFVNLLLAPGQQQHRNIYVVLTMRSDFLGECTKFRGLAEAVNDAQYLIPRMTRSEQRIAISGPASVARSSIDPVLLTRLVNDVGDDPDQLSILQHALNRTWSEWEQDPTSDALKLQHYEAIGTMEDALDKHAERAFAELTDTQKVQCERLFRALTDTSTDQRGIRRPTEWSDLVQIVGGDKGDLIEIIDTFRKPSRSFLMPPAGTELSAGHVVDISHESLMRIWRRLREWTFDEAKSAGIYGRLIGSARRHETEDANLLRSRDLQQALEWEQSQNPTEAWSRQYGTSQDFTQAIAFLRKSETEEARATAAQAKSARKQRRLKRLLVAVAAATVVAVMFGLQWYQNSNERLELASREAAALNLQADSFAVIREAELGDPVKGAIIALKSLATLKTEGHDLKTDEIENALWQAYAHMHQTQIMGDHAGIMGDHGAEIRGLAISEDGTRFATGGHDGRVFVYAFDPDSGRWSRVHELEVGTGRSKPDRVLSLAMDPKGKRLVTGTYRSDRKGGLAELWDLETGAKIAQFIPSGADDVTRTRTSGVVNIAFDPTGNIIATASYDGTLRLWEAATQRPLAVVDAHERGAYGVAINPAAEFRGIVASVGMDGYLRIWDAGMLLEDQIGPPCARHYELAANDAAPQGIDEPSAAGIRQCTAALTHSALVRSVAFSKDGRFAITASNDDTVKVWDWRRLKDCASDDAKCETGQVGRPLPVHDADLWRAVEDTSGTRLLTASWDRTVGVWDAKTFGLIKRNRGHDGPVRNVGFSAAANAVISTSRDGTARTWKISGPDIRNATLSPDEPEAMAVDPTDPSAFATGGHDGVLYVWRSGNRSPTKSLKPDAMACDVERWVPTCRIDDIAYARSGKWIALVRKNYSVEIWNTQTWQSRTLSERLRPGHQRLVFIDIDGRDVLAFGSTQKEGRVRMHFVDPETGEKLTGGIYDDPGFRLNENIFVAFASNAALDLLAAADTKGKITVWNLPVTRTTIERREICTGGWINALTFSDLGDRIFSADDGWTITASNLDNVKVVSDGGADAACGPDPEQITMTGSKGSILDLSFHLASGRLASVGDDEVIRIWNTETGSQVTALPGHSGTITRVAIVDRSEKKDGNDLRLMSVSRDDTIQERQIFTDLDSLAAEVCHHLESMNLRLGGYLGNDERIENFCS